jgi:hypothetical protein
MLISNLLKRASRIQEKLFLTTQCSKPRRNSQNWSGLSCSILVSIAMLCIVVRQLFLYVCFNIYLFIIFCSIYLGLRIYVIDFYILKYLSN